MQQFIYFVSPMCSWCWGFSPVIQKLQQAYPENTIQAVLTPFRIDTNQPMDKSLRDYVMGQWRNVNRTTGQPFDFNFSMPEDFIYNTRLACLSIKAFCKQLPQQELEFLGAIQYSFYTENKDLTDINVLMDIANCYSINEKTFMEDLQGREVQNQLEQDFDLCRKLEVQSYPTLMTKQEDSYTMLVSGYNPFESVVTKINANLDME
jgi:putative protein-disulfide isomerase